MGVSGFRQAVARLESRLMRRSFYYRGQVYEDSDGDWRWRVVARNGQVIATSHEGYKNRAHAARMCKRICRVRKVTIDG